MGLVLSQHNEVLNLFQPVESTSIQEVCKGEGVGHAIGIPVVPVARSERCERGLSQYHSISFSLARFSACANGVQLVIGISTNLAFGRSNHLSSDHLGAYL